MKYYIIINIFFILCYVFADNDLKNFQLSDECSNEYSLYNECIEIYNENVGDLSKMCSAMNEKVCEQFITDINNISSNCLKNTSNYMDIVNGISIIRTRISYLTFCIKDNNGDLCPFSQYLINNNYDIDGTYDEMNNLNAFTNSIINDCKISQCNERFQTLESMITHLGYIKFDGNVDDDDNDFNSNNDYNDVDNINDYVFYLEYFKTNNCDGIREELATFSDDCLKELDEYKSCIDHYPSIYDGNDLDDYCKIFESGNCKSLIDDLNVENSNCFKNNSSSKDDYINGLLLFTEKYYYTNFCTRTTSGKICPFSEYLLNIENSNNILESISEDCQDSNCNKRIIDNEEIFGKLNILLSDDETSELTVQRELYSNFIQNYKDKTCSAIITSNSSINSYINDNDNNKGNEENSSISNKKNTFPYIVMISLIVFLLI
eukprot:jgi/Orpsp1_1/1179215/evm.model.c7180000068456.1